MGGRGRKGWEHRPFIAVEPWSMNLGLSVTVKAERPYTFPMPPAADTVTRGYQVVGTGWAVTVNIKRDVMAGHRVRFRSARIPAGMVELNLYNKK
jgi:hypothetical protein